jgi:hypothetical protein
MAEKSAASYIRGKEEEREREMFAGRKALTEGQHTVVKGQGSLYCCCS